MSMLGIEANTSLPACLIDDAALAKSRHKQLASRVCACLLVLLAGAALGCGGTVMYVHGHGQAYNTPKMISGMMPMSWIGGPAAWGVRCARYGASDGFCRAFVRFTYAVGLSDPVVHVLSGARLAVDSEPWSSSAMASYETHVIPPENTSQITAKSCSSTRQDAIWQLVCCMLGRAECIPDPWSRRHSSCCRQRRRAHHCWRCGIL